MDLKVQDLKKNPINIQNFLTSNKRGVSSEEVKEIFGLKNIKGAGIYAFWWIGEQDYNFNHNLKLKGPKTKGKSEHKEFNVEWERFLNKSQIYQCLYVGKTTDIRQRLSMHLMLETDNWYDGKKYTEKYKKGYIFKRNSQCQFRAGFEHLLSNETNIEHRKILLENIAISFIEIDGDKSLVERFYMEDYAIGYYRPWFNLDSER